MESFKSCIYFCLLFNLFAVGLNETVYSPVVTIKQGQLRGSVETLYDGSTYYSFKGIPFAKTPIKELRFTAPQPPEPWTDRVRDAIKHGAVCAQYDGSQFIGDEECLFINVYTKSLDPKSKIPVMVYIYGGSYSSGSGDSDTYTPDFLMPHGVILVTFNYRLELLGFTSVDTPEVPGNAGMKDQVAALRWVKQNIAKFGGDPNKVTIFGESSGASSVTHHMLSPMSKGLFHRAIAQSGVSIVDWGIGRGAKARAFRVAKLFNKHPKNTDDLLKFLRSEPALALTNLTERTLTEDEKYRGLPEHFIPVVEKKFHNVEAFFDEEPIDILLKGKMNKVPLLVGYNSAEGLIIMPSHLEKLDIYNAQSSYYVPREIAEKVSQQKLIEFGDRIKKFYVGNRNITKDDRQIVVNMQTDIHFGYNAQRFSYLYKRFHEPVYMYRFNFDTDLNVIKRDLNLTDLPGACHADDLFYLFYNAFNKEAYDSQLKLREIVFNIAKFWTDFAKTGNPTPTNSGVHWEAYGRRHKQYLMLDDSLRVSQYADRERIQFWNTLYKEAGLPYIDGDC